MPSTPREDGFVGSIADQLYSSVDGKLTNLAQLTQSGRNFGIIFVALLLQQTEDLQDLKDLQPGPAVDFIFESNNLKLGKAMLYRIIDQFKKTGQLTPGRSRSITPTSQTTIGTPTSQDR